MPPRRSRSRTAAGSLQLRTAVLQALSLPQLRDICQTNGLPVTGNRNVLTERLRDAGIALEGSDERGEQNNRRNNPSPMADPPASERPQSFTNEQMTTIKRFVQEAVSDAATGIASEAAKAAVNAMRAQQNSPFAPADAILPTQQQQQVLGSSPLSQEIQATLPGHSPGTVDTSLQNGAPFQAIPSAYVQEIQTGEFFDLSKLLPKNLSIHDEGDNLVLSLDNSVVKVSKKKTSGAGLGWAVYDYKFRQKASTIPIRDKILPHGQVLKKPAAKFDMMMEVFYCYCFFPWEAFRVLCCFCGCCCRCVCVCLLLQICNSLIAGSRFRMDWRPLWTVFLETALYAVSLPFLCSRRSQKLAPGRRTGGAGSASHVYFTRTMRLCVHPEIPSEISGTVAVPNYNSN